MKGIRIIIILIGLLSIAAFSQENTQDLLAPRIAPISYELEGNTVFLRAATPALNQIAGAPNAFYTYHWEFGDGNYSTKAAPKHTYKKPGFYQTRLWATNNYDNGAPPSSRPTSVTIDSSGDQASIEDKSPFIDDDDLMIKRNREPVPNQEMVLITSYKNTNNYVTSGKLYLFYNDTQFINNNFKLQDTRLHHGERIATVDGYVYESEENDDHTLLASSGNLIAEYNILQSDSTKRRNLPLTLEESKALYRNHQVIEFDNMQPGEERNIFRTLQTTPEMIKDTSAIVTLRSVYVPDVNYDNHTVKETEMEIVTSHDPNKMSSNGWLMNYRLVRFKRLKFKVRFQNNGEGPANTIRLESDTPQLFDKSTLRIDGMYPECPICPKNKEVNYSCLDTILKKDKIIFTFKRIYLPGTAQKGVTEIDSTKGFVKYSMKFAKDFHKQKTKSRTAIYFDKNDPIITNYAATRFMPGISIGAKAGYIMRPGLNNQQEFFVGATVSPFKSYRAYYQAELLFSSATYTDTRNFENTVINPDGSRTLTQFSELNQFNTISAYVVPASVRYNLNNYVALGAGVQLKMDLTSQNDQETSGEAFIIGGNGIPVPNPDLNSFSENKIRDSFINAQTGVFIGMNIGTVRLGPSLGVRYIHNFEAPSSQIQLYGIWKF